jgi:hypothetical protein
MAERDQQRFEVDGDVLYQPVEDEVVLLNLKSQQYYGLDAIGARIWQLLVETGNVDTVADRLCEEYDADRSRVLHDVESMVQDFCAAGLVKTGTARTGDTSHNFPEDAR